MVVNLIFIYLILFNIIRCSKGIEKDKDNELYSMDSRTEETEFNKINYVVKKTHKIKKYSQPININPIRENTDEMKMHGVIEERFYGFEVGFDEDFMDKLISNGYADMIKDSKSKSESQMKCKKEIIYGNIKEMSFKNDGIMKNVHNIIQKTISEEDLSMDLFYEPLKKIAKNEEKKDLEPKEDQPRKINILNTNKNDEMVYDGWDEDLQKIDAPKLRKCHACTQRTHFLCSNLESFDFENSKSTPLSENEICEIYSPICFERSIDESLMSNENDIFKTDEDMEKDSLRYK